MPTPPHLLRALPRPLGLSLVVALTLLAPAGAWSQDDAPLELDEDWLDDPDPLDPDSLDPDPEAIHDEGALEVDDAPPLITGPIDVTYSDEERFEAGGSVQALDEATLERFERDDPQAILMQVPGVYVRQEDGFGLRPNIGIRGASSERSRKITLMEDGVLFGPAPYSAPAAYFFPMITRMVGVEVIKGPGALLFGPNTIGGALNLITRRAPERGFAAEADAALGLYLTTRAHLHVGYGWERAGLLLEGAHVQSDGFKEIDGGGDAGISRSEFMLRAHLTSDPLDEVYHRLDFKGGYSRERSHETYLGLSDEDFAADPYRRYRASALDALDLWRTQAQVDYRIEAGEALDARLTGYRHDMGRSWRKLNGFGDGPTLEALLANPTSGRNRVFYDVLTGAQDTSIPDEALIIGDNTRTYVSQGAQLIAHHRLAPASVRWLDNEVELGLRLHNDAIERDHTEDAYAMRRGALERDQTPTRAALRNRGETLALAIHLIDRLALGPLTLTPGARFEWMQMSLRDLETGTEAERSDAILLPGLGAHYAITPEVGVLAGVHRGFSPVSPGQPESISPETSVNYEAGARVAFPDAALQGELIGFFNDYGDLIGECSFSVGCAADDLDQQSNPGSVHVYGLEALAAWSPTAADNTLSFPLQAAYTLTLSEFTTAFAADDPQYGDVAVGDSLPYVPAHQVSLSAGVALAHPALALNLGYVHVSPMRERAGQRDDDLMTDPQHLLDALISYQPPLPGLTLYARGDNLLDSDPLAARRPYGARPLRPLTVLFGAKLEYASP